MLHYLLENDDAKIEKLELQYSENTLSDSEIVEIFSTKVTAFLEEHQNNKNCMKEFLDSYTHSGKLAAEMWSKIHI